ncbi:MAG: phosphoserine aminotransferase [Bacteroidia bacterium]|jgi:phosphoserine aminotransferase
MMNQKHNFSAGPAILPTESINAGIEALSNFEGTGLSILEVSHRGKEFVNIMSEAKKIVLELLKLDDRYEVLYLQGGASTQFLMVAMNLLNKKAVYVDTGTWSSKAIKEAKLFGDVEVIASSADKKYTYIPTINNVPKDADYLHFTSNNTIYGTQFQNFPTSSIPLVCDMSSDIFSREFDASAFDLIYAGAQKNLGPAGATLVIIKKEILGKVERKIPTILNYQTHIDKESMFNTPPVFSVFVVYQTLKWIKKIGIAEIERRNNAKAGAVYAEIDRNPLFIGAVNKADRSKMNVTFLLNDETKSEAFLKACSEANISGLKGHRSVGGFRASLYNALPIESVNVLVGVMKNFK